jgi:hypothetical protein
MPNNESTPNRDRRLLYAAAGLGAVLVGVLVMRITSGSGDDVAVGVVPRATTPATSTTTTVALSASTADAAAALASPLDPFHQIVTPPAASQSVQAAGPGQVTQATQANAVSQGASTSTTKAATTTTTRAATPPTTQAAASAEKSGAGPTTMLTMFGPFAVAGVPLNICVDNGTQPCTLTPAAVTSVSLWASATIDPGAPRPPTLVAGACSNGHGVASLITSGSNGSVITGSVVATVNGSQNVFPVAVGATAPDQTVIISACAPPGVGVPIAQSGTQSTTPGLLGTVSNVTGGLLGVLSADSGLLAGT